MVLPHHPPPSSLTLHFPHFFSHPPFLSLLSLPLPHLTLPSPLFPSSLPPHVPLLPPSSFYILPSSPSSPPSPLTSFPILPSPHSNPTSGFLAPNQTLSPPLLLYPSLSSPLLSLFPLHPTLNTVEALIIIFTLSALPFDLLSPADGDPQLSTSDENVVTLRKIDLSSEGTYRCEVMSEAPTFETSFGSANLTVVHMPQNPQITGLQIKYTEGDKLRINCTVRDSRPAAVISFRVNGREVHPDSGRVIELPMGGGGDDPYALYTTSSQLTLPLGKNYLNGISIECEGKVLNLAVKKSVFAAVVRQSSTFSFFNAGAPRVNPPTMILVLVSAALTHLLNT
ncbi:hypothetical protein C7M84_002093 [Penaeus vannamei]|uniref:Ig-like domain-containing protein n=1 Tax=Penaeus vannamei TaxID=6689 RepID=A0A3R7P9E7_PENVA|nr:hypothetical protein C7M84_002093 [Penaeus vannamei]